MARPGKELGSLPSDIMTMNRRKRGKEGRIAVCSFQDRVCPRFDLTPEILIFDTNRSRRKPIEKVDVSRLSPTKVPDILADRKVSVVISGGIQGKFHEMLLGTNIDVIWGVAGEVKDVVEAYAKGALRCGIGLVS